MLVGIRGILPPTSSPAHYYHQHAVHAPAARRDDTRKVLADHVRVKSGFNPAVAPSGAATVVWVGTCEARATTVSGDVIGLPSHPRLTVDEQARAVKATRSAR